MQQNRLMKIAAVCCMMFVSVAMGVMIYFSANKIIVVADVAQDEVAQNTEQTQNTEKPGEKPAEEAADKNSIRFERGGRNTNYFCIPMPESVKAEDVTIENHYMDQELWVNIQFKEMSGQDKFYEDNYVFGNCENVTEGHFEAGDTQLYLKFAVTDVYEYQSIFENNILYLDFVAPKEVYDKIVVIDAAYGAEDTGTVVDGIAEKDIALRIAREVKNRLDATDIKVYYTRMDDSNPPDDGRVKLAKATRADMLIRIEVGESENTKEYGTEAVYNSKFFIPGFGSVELADLLEREVVTAISGKANGLVEAAKEDTVIMDATVPAAAIRVGYLTNGQEEILLQRDDYIGRIADGIYNAIMKAYEENQQFFD